MERTKIFAHRGASGYAPENTIPAFELAHRQGADGIELDVQLTKDGEVVVIHDETIDRVSTGKGLVRDHTLRELRQFSFHNGMKEYAGGVAIPTLAEVLRLVKPWGIKVNIELKTGIYRYSGLEEKTAGVVRGEGMEARVIYSSFNHYSIREIQKISPGVETAYLFNDVALDMPGYARRNGVDGLHPALHHVQMPGLLEEYQRSGLALRVWTVNQKDELKMLFSAGITAVITNVPDIALQVRGDRENCLSSLPSKFI